MHRPQFELYDIQRDPDEVTNLAADPRHTATLAGLKERIKTVQQRTKDPWVHKWEYE